MNDQVQNIINACGALTELWLISYNNFIRNGLDKEEALCHTQAMFEVVIGNMFQNGKDD